MSGFAEMEAEMNRHRFIQCWVPDARAEDLEITDERTRWFLARALAAEAELKEINSALKALRKAMPR